MFVLAICHTVIASVNEEDNEMQYTATSPDELALVNFAKFVGVEYQGLDEQERILIKFQNQVHVFKKLELFEFDSDRKRQSIIVQDANEQIFLFCKGADSVIKDRAAPSNFDYINTVKKKLGEFGDEGLRTLAIAERRLTKQEYDTWKQSYHLAQTTLTQREESIKQCQENIEQQLILLGATAIEDKLQRDVPKTIEKLLDAGIKVWVLTGDKIETAINIGFSCKLINNLMIRFEVTDPDQMSLEDSLKQIEKQIEKYNNNNDGGGGDNKKETANQKYALVISGEALNNIEIPHISV